MLDRFLMDGRDVSRHGRFRVYRGSSHATAVMAAVAVNGLALALTAGASIIWARTLGVEGRGEFSAVQSWPVLLAGFGSLGVQDALVFFAARNRSLTASYLRFSLLVIGISSLVFGAGVYWVLPIALRAQTPAVIASARLGLILAPLWMALAVCSAVFQGLQNHKLWNVLRLLQPAAGFLAGVTALLLFGHYISVKAATITLIALLGFAAAAALVVVHTSVAPSRSPTTFHKWPYVRYGLYSGAANGPRQLNIRLDQMLMPAFLGAAALGYYAVGASWAYMGFYVVLAIGSSSIAALARTRDATVQRDLLIRTMVISVGAVMAIGLLVFLLAPIGLRLLFGAQYLPAVPVTRVLVFAAALSTLNGVWGDMLRGLGLPEKAFGAETLGMVITIPALFLAIPKFGILGAAWVSVAAYASVLSVQTAALVVGGATRGKPSADAAPL